MAREYIIIVSDNAPVDNKDNYETYDDGQLIYRDGFTNRVEALEEAIEVAINLNLRSWSGQRIEVEVVER